MRHLLKIFPFAALFFTSVLLVFRYGSKDLLVVVLSFSIIAPLVYLVIDRFVQKNNLLQMKEEALRAELALLKNQIDPHFFFNTLNNLYALSLTGSEKAPELILKLSDLMRFTIYEGRKDHVLLRDELAYLQNYLEIQKIRAKLNRVEVTFETQVEDDLIEVPPLMFIMLVENAVKHGSETKTDGAFIHIKLKADLREITFSIENNYDDPAQESRLAARPGIGLTNLRRRLVLLFPGRHTFVAGGADGVYRAQLRLQL